MLFPDDVRTYGRANFDYDALIASEHGNKHVLSFLDCDLARLKRFKEGLEFYSDKLGEVACYPWMTEFVRKYTKQVWCIASALYHTHFKIKAP